MNGNCNYLFGTFPCEQPKNLINVIMFGVLICRCMDVSDRQITILLNFMRNSESDNEYQCNPCQRNLQTIYDFKEF